LTISMNFVLKMDSDSFKPECQYFDIYPHDFWLAACYSTNFQAWSVMCVITLNDRCHLVITNNGFIQAFFVSL